jgi:hypothetical protein
MSMLVRVGHRATVYVSDPWEFGTRCGVGPFEAVVEDIRPDMLLLTLDGPLQYDGPVYSVVARPRYAGAIDTWFGDTNEMAANLILLRERIQALNDISNSAWKDALVALGSVRLRR